jgi:hypothetical protein
MSQTIFRAVLQDFIQIDGAGDTGTNAKIDHVVRILMVSVTDLGQSVGPIAVDHEGFQTRPLFDDRSEGNDFFPPEIVCPIDRPTLVVDQARCADTETRYHLPRTYRTHVLQAFD